VADMQPQSVRIPSGNCGGGYGSPQIPSPYARVGPQAGKYSAGFKLVIVGWICWGVALSTIVGDICIFMHAAANFHLRDTFALPMWVLLLIAVSCLLAGAVLALTALTWSIIGLFRKSPGNPKSVTIALSLLLIIVEGLTLFPLYYCLGLCLVMIRVV